MFKHSYFGCVHGTHLLASEVKMWGEGLGVPQGDDGALGQTAPHARVGAKQLYDLGNGRTGFVVRPAIQPPELPPVGLCDDDDVPATGAPKRVLIGTVNGDDRVHATSRLRFAVSASKLDDNARVFERILQSSPLVGRPRKHQYISVECTYHDVRTSGPAGVPTDAQDGAFHAAVEGIGQPQLRGQLIDMKPATLRSGPHLRLPHQGDAHYLRVRHGSHVGARTKFHRERDRKSVDGTR